MKNERYYVVLTKSGKRRLALRSTPRTGPELSGDIAEVGPFRTLRGAKFFRDRRSPYCVCVDDAETLAGAWKRVAA